MYARNGEQRPKIVSALRQRLRQRRFPPEFRIPPGYMAVESMPAESMPPERTQPRQPHVAADGQEPSDSALADLATSLWRLDRKLADGETGTDGDGRKGGPGQRMAARHLRAARDALAKAGVETRDHDGMEFDLGLSLDVLAYQPTSGATRQTVLETIRPSVFRNGRSIQIGQVIVARPEGEQGRDT